MKVYLWITCVLNSPREVKLNWLLGKGVMEMKAKFDPPEGQAFPVLKREGQAYEFIGLPDGVDSRVDLDRFWIRVDGNQLVAEKKSRALLAEERMWSG